MPKRKALGLGPDVFSKGGTADPEQLARFAAASRELECDESPEAFVRAVRMVAKPRTAGAKRPTATSDASRTGVESSRNDTTGDDQ
jgi:hypothetical protein